MGFDFIIRPGIIFTHCKQHNKFRFFVFGLLTEAQTAFKPFRVFE
jgi:hypothetical protein